MEKPSDIARRAVETAEAGDLPAAIPEFERALSIADPKKDDLWFLHMSFAVGLAVGGEYERAIGERRAAIAAAIRQGDDDAVPIERYFIAELFLVLGRPNDAISEVADLTSSSNPAGYLLSVHARALHAAGELDAARSVAWRALHGARDDEARARYAENLREILGA